jgi:hypothetical protein
MKAKVDEQKKLNSDIMDDVEMINTDVPKPMVKKVNPLMYDKVYQALLDSTVVLEEFT